MKCLHTHRLPSVYFGPRLLLYLRTLDLSPALMLFSPPPNILSILIFDLTLPSPPKINFRFFFFTLALAGMYRPWTRSTNVLIPWWFFWVCLNNLNVLNILSFLLSPQQKIPEPGLRSQNVDLKLHLFLLPLCFLPPFLFNFWHALGLQESHYFTQFPFGSWETEEGLWTC